MKSLIMKGKSIKVLTRKASPLTERELEVLMLICREFSPNEISSRLQISEKTFFNHRANILAKTQTKSNVGLFRFAVQYGYCPLSNR
ncbi:MAG: response regulator transcription factor [Cyclobacteriaceae bacterium]|nr:response regulator transcription factor [Cyclobacteriaceae bacterium]MBX2958293.1 response regulator transcription factor [Cyclobacteriaceae bacterium]